MKALYSDTSKRDIIEQLVEGYSAGKYSHQPNGSAEKQVNGDTSPFEASTFYFLAQHYNYHLSRNLDKAMHNIEKAIERSPKSVDYHMTKARIWKHHGNTRKASETMEQARSLDDKDRYINSKAAKYQLRNDENDAAIKTMSKFTRNETVGGPLGDLHDMQCTWYITEDGESYLRQGKLGQALKRFTAIYNLFDIWQEDQFDFHAFSLRKGQIRAYVNMVRWEDHLREHPFYSRAAIQAVKTYIALHDNPQLAHGPMTNGVDGPGGLENMGSNERRKAVKKAKKDQQKQEKAEAEQREAKKTTTAATDQNGDKKKEDTDPLGKTLAQTTEPLKDAMKFLGPLLEFSPKDIRAQNVGFEVFVRRSKPPRTPCKIPHPTTRHTYLFTNRNPEKYLLALRCLLAARSIDPANPAASPLESISHLQSSSVLSSLLSLLSHMPPFRRSKRKVDKSLHVTKKPVHTRPKNKERQSNPNPWDQASPSRTSHAAPPIDPANPTLHQQTIHFRHILDSLPSPFPPKIAEVLTSEFAPVLPPDTDLDAYNASFRDNHPASAAHLHAFIQARRILHPAADADARERDRKDLLATLELESITLPDAVAGLDLLRACTTEPDAVDEYLAAARTRWPEATAFQPAA